MTTTAALRRLRRPATKRSTRRNTAKHGSARAPWSERPGSSLGRALLVVSLLSAAVLLLCCDFGLAQDQAGTRYSIFLFRSDGKPAAGASLRVMGAEKELASLNADGEGRIRVEGLKPGEPAFFLASSTDGREKAFLPVLVVPEGRHQLTLYLYPPGFVRGELLDEMGKPAAGVPVRLSGWERLPEPALGGRAATDQLGRFKIQGLIAGAYYSLTAWQGPEDAPHTAWRSPTFRIYGWDGWHDVGILLPEGSEPSAERPPGETVASVTSGSQDEWYDSSDKHWRPAVETYDPNRAWAPAPEGATWIWRAGRPDALAEKYGATVEFRRLFALPPGKKVTGYLTIAADDYVGIRLNGKWVGQTDQYMRTVSMIVPPGVFRAGSNELRLTVRNIAGTKRDFYNPSGVTYRLDLIAPEGQ